MKALALSILFSLALTRGQSQMAMPADEPMAMSPDTIMTSSLSLSLPMNLDGSGTSWQPDKSIEHAYMLHGKCDLMLHGDIFFRYNEQNFNNKNKRGNHAMGDAPNMFMGMASRQIGKNGL